MYEPLEFVKCENCGNIIAEPKELIKNKKETRWKPFPQKRKNNTIVLTVVNHAQKKNLNRDIAWTVTKSSSLTTLERRPKMMSIQFNGKTVRISFPSDSLRSKRRIPTERINPTSP